MIMDMFRSNEFKSASKDEKRQMLGNAIYEAVEKVTGSGKAPKVTGMLIDLSPAELN